MNKKKLFEHLFGRFSRENERGIIVKLEALVNDDIPVLARYQEFYVDQAIMELASHGICGILAIMPVATYINSCR